MKTSCVETEMIKVFDLLVLLLFQVPHLEASKKIEVPRKNPTSINPDNWRIYEAHFRLIRFLTIHIIQTKLHSFEVNQYVKTLIGIHNSRHYVITVQIKETVLSEEPRERQVLLPDPESPGQIFDPVDDAKFLEIKRLSSDSVEGTILIAWDPDVVHQFFDETAKDALHKARKTYVLLFVAKFCEKIQSKLGFLLERFWTEFNILNLLVQTPRSCSPKQVSIYRPFYRNGSRWGRVDSYTFKQILDNLRLITNPITNLNHFSLKVAIFQKSPEAVRSLPKMLQTNPIYRNLSWSKGFAGIDGMILGTLAEYLNFNVVPMGTTVWNNYGKVVNGTFSGTLDDVIKRRVIYSANNRFVADYSTDQLEFTVPYSDDEICVVVPKAVLKPKWQTFLKCFDLLTWVCIVLTWTVCIAFWYYIGPSRDLLISFSQLFYFMMGIPRRFIPSVDQFCFLASCMAFSIIVLGLLQGSLFKNFTSLDYDKDVDTLEEVEAMNLPIAANVWYLLDDCSDIVQRLKRRSTSASESTFDLVAYQRNIVAIETKLYLQLISRAKYVDSDGRPLLHIVEECLNTYVVANILPKGSAFLTVFNDIITKLLESGLTQKWYYDVVDSTIAEAMINLPKKPGGARAFTLEDIKNAFYVMVVGYTCSTLVLFFEVLVKNKL